MGSGVVDVGSEAGSGRAMIVAQVSMKAVARTMVQEMGEAALERIQVVAVDGRGQPVQQRPPTTCSSSNVDGHRIVSAASSGRP